MKTRLISFANTTLALTYRGAEPARIIDFLYRHVPAHPEPPPSTTYHLHPGQTTGQVCLHREEIRLYEGEPEVVAELLLGDSSYHLAARSREGLLFHAGGLAREGLGLLLPGQSGAGKSTLTAWLLTQGFDYLSDELIFIPSGTGIMIPMSRPLNLKHSARGVLQPYLEAGPHPERILRSTQVDLISSELFKPTPPLPQAFLKRIIFPHYRPKGKFELQPLSKAQAGLELMRCLINARNLTEHGFPELTRLVKEVPAYKMSYSSFEGMGDRMMILLGEAGY